MKYWIRLITCCTAFGTGNKNVGRAIEHFFCLRFSFDPEVSNSKRCMACTNSMRHSAGAHKTLQMLDVMLDLYDHPEQSSTEQGGAKSNKLIHYSVKCWVRLTRALRPWPNDSIFHSNFSSTFDLKVERLLSVVEHMWPNGSILCSTFLSTFPLLIFPQRMSAKNIYHHKYLPSQISRCCACFHSTCSTRWPNGSIFTQQQFFCSIFLTKINFTQHHSTPLDSLNKVAKRLDFSPDFLLSKNSSEKSSRLARA